MTPFSKSGYPLPNWEIVVRSEVFMRIILAALLFPLVTHAQKVDVKDVNSGSENTTIKIEKGPQAVKKQVKWETQEGGGDVEGDSGATTKEAKANWKKACDDWKKEIREDNNFRDKEKKFSSELCPAP